VVQLGSGCTPEAGAQAPGEKRGWWPWWTASTVTVLQQDLLTAVPIRVAVEKFRGFVADHRAKIASIEGNHVQLEIDDSRSHSLRRRSDRPVTFCLDVRFEEEQVERPSPGGSPGRTASRTKIRAAIAPSKTRDRRRGDVDTRAREVLASFRSYLMATEEGPPASRGVLRRARSFLIPWLTGR